ncbi:MAG: MGMT family protein, partial [Clostridia bacterium]|nr:MGMT family protein [Clostridia bacterium]
IQLEGYIYRNLYSNVLLFIPFMIYYLVKGREIMSAQAVGGAVGHNPISIIIPCHRVIGARGDLTGYAGGIEIKKRLLEFEKI